MYVVINEENGNLETLTKGAKNEIENQFSLALHYDSHFEVKFDLYFVRMSRILDNFSPNFSILVL